jgi:hypothetical protein
LKLGVGVCDATDAAALRLAPVQIWITHDRSPHRVNRFVVANGLTYVFSTFKDRFVVSEESPGVFVAPVSCAAVARLMRRRAAFVFAGVLFRFHAAPPSPPRGQRSDGAGPTLALTFGTLAFPPVSLAELIPFPVAPRACRVLSVGPFTMQVS